MSFVAAGCGPTVSGTDPDGTATGTSGGSGQGDGTTATQTSGMETGVSSTGLDDDSGSTTPTADLGPCGAPPHDPCDPLADECGGGDHECTFEHPPRGDGWVCGCNLGDKGPYEECGTFSDPADDCAPTQICADSGLAGGALCRPICGSPLCTAESVCVDGFCAEPCDPLSFDTCPGLLSCSPADGGFLCVTTVGFLRPSGPGDSCSGPGTCDHGLVCLPGADVGHCGGWDQCCTAVCDQAVMGSCEPGQICTPLFDDPWPGSETLGACTTP